MTSKNGLSTFAWYLSVHILPKLNDMSESELEIEAEKLFLRGAELEQSNNTCDAVRYYRKAMQLVPDIDVKVFKKSRQKESSKENEENYHKNGKREEYTCANSEDEFDSNEPLFERFQRLLINSDRICLHQKRSSNKALQLFDLPDEIIDYILRWVVSDELDLRSLDQCALVCRGLYLLARSPHLWKSACIRSFKSRNIELGNYESWRDMFVNHPRVGTNGCYISETKYFRQGENSFQDMNYSGLFHLVIYYRYLRFFADGSVLMINTPDAPSTVVGQLKYKNYSKLGAAVIPGSYRIIEDFVFVTFEGPKIKRSTTKTSKARQTTMTFYMKFQIEKFRKWHSKLLWKEYKLLCPDDLSYEEEFEIREQAFPPLKFSVVRSYLTESERPLP